MIPGLSSLTEGSAAVGGGLGKLFDLAVEGALPRNRGLQPWEPETLTRVHLGMVLMDAAGLRSEEISGFLGVTQATVAVILGHPDAEYIRNCLETARFTAADDIETRLDFLESDAVLALETALRDNDIPTLKKAAMGFELLKLNGRAKERPRETTVRHRLEGSPAAMELLAKSIREAKEIPEAEYVVIPPGGELPRELPSGTDAPPISGPQELS